MQHPDITRIERYGYAKKESEIGRDFFGHTFYEGEELYIFEDEVFVAEELSSDAKQILEYFGAIKK